MIVYILIIMITTVLAAMYQSTKFRKLFFSFMVFVPSFFSGFRNVGTDYFLYLTRFRYVCQGNDFDASGTNLTGLFYHFLKLVGIVFDNYQIAICLISFVTIFIAFYLICQYQDEISIPIAVFSYMTMFYFLAYNIFRQSLAAEIYALGVFYVIKRKRKIVGIILLMCSVVIHSAVLPFALSTVILAWISDESKIKTRIGVYIISFLGIMLLPSMKAITMRLLTALPHYAFYFLSFEFTGFGIGVFRYIFLVFTVVIILKKAGCLSDKIYVSYTFLSMVGAILTWLSYVSTTFIYRIGYIGMVFLPILHGYFVRRFLRINLKNGSICIACKNTSIGKVGGIFSIGMCIFLLFFFWYDYINLNSGEILPYTMSFFAK